MRSGISDFGCQGSGVAGAIASEKDPCNGRALSKAAGLPPANLPWLAGVSSDTRRTGQDLLIRRLIYYRGGSKAEQEGGVL